MTDKSAINAELEAIRIERATKGTMLVKQKADFYALSRFNSLDERMNKSQDFQATYVPIQPDLPWYVRLMVNVNDRLRHFFGLTLNSDIEIIEPDEIPEVTKYEPGKYKELSLVHTTVIEKIGHKWRKRTYWRIAGEKIHGRYDYIRCDGPEMPVKQTYVPANFRRSKFLDTGKSGKRGKKNSETILHVGIQPADSQLKRNKIASVPMSIRYMSAVKLMKRLDEQAAIAFHKGNKERYDTLDNRANQVQQWIAHVASQYPDLFFKKADSEPKTDKQKLAADIKAMPKTYRVKSATDKKTATKLRTARIERQQRWSTRMARTNGAHLDPKRRK